MPDPLIGARLEHPGLGIGVGFLALQMEREEGQLDLFAKVFPCFRAEVEIAQRVSIAARPAAVIPRSHDERVGGFGSGGFDGTEQLQRA